MEEIRIPADVLDGLHEMFSRSFQGAAEQILASQPYETDADAPLMAALQELRQREHGHALALAVLIDGCGAVAKAGAFAYWHLDINYLSVPHAANFVVDALADDLAKLAALLERCPDDAPGVADVLASIRREKAEQHTALAAQVKDALARETAAYREEAATARASRERIAARKKAAEDARKQAEREAKAAAKGAS